MGYLEPAGKILTILDDVIKYSKELVTYLTPQYKEAAKGLRQITDIIYTDISRLLQWQVKLQNMDFSKGDSKEKFREFKENLEQFKNTPEYHAFRGDCHEMQALYHEYVRRDLKRLFVHDTDKMEKADRVFEALGHTDDSMGGLAYFLFRQAEDAVEKIDKDFQEAQNIRNRFKEEIKPIRQALDGQAQDLDELRITFQKLSEGRILG